jgi:YidC/Oxa1 family membrane protein insertase
MDSVFGPIFDAVGWALAQFYAVVPNLGVAIILLTLLIMLLLYPLTAKQTRSMMAMQRVQPEIKKLQAKYKGDRQKLNEETMKFYQENKINPLAGCLPLLVQMPLLISLFGVLRNAYKYVPTSSSLYRAFCSGLTVGGKNYCGADSTSAVISKLRHLPSGVSKGDTVINHLHFAGLDLQKSATAAHNGFFDAAPYFVLVVLVIISYWLSSRQAQKRTPAANKQMGAVMKILPPFFGLISIGLPSGVVLYLFVSSLFRLGQQEVIFRRHGHLRYAPLKGAIDVKSKARPAPAAAAIEADTDDAEVEDEDEPVVVEERRPARPAAVAARPPARPAGRATGLRGFLQLPPPPEPNGETASAAVSARSGGEHRAAGSSGASGSTGGRASGQRRRRSKKKRKR